MDTLSIYPFCVENNSIDYNSDSGHIFMNICAGVALLS